MSGLETLTPNLPDPKYLGTRAARDPAMIDWAYERSVAADRVGR